MTLNTLSINEKLKMQDIHKPTTRIICFVGENAFYETTDLIGIYVI
jgi:hypothetical protein